MTVSTVFFILNQTVFRLVHSLKGKLSLRSFSFKFEINQKSIWRSLQDLIEREGISTD